MPLMAATRFAIESPTSRYSSTSSQSDSQYTHNKTIGSTYQRRLSNTMASSAAQQHLNIYHDAHYQDLAPQVLRQRLIVEGYPSRPVTEGAIKDYLCRLSDLIRMRPLLEPVTHRSDLYGWAGWIHWETSGAHFYAWERPLLFFSVDIYSCKAFDVSTALEFTGRYFEATKLSSKSF